MILLGKKHPCLATFRCACRFEDFYYLSENSFLSQDYATSEGAVSHNNLYFINSSRLLDSIKKTITTVDQLHIKLLREIYNAQ